MVFRGGEGGQEKRESSPYMTFTSTFSVALLRLSITCVL